MKKLSIGQVAGAVSLCVTAFTMAPAQAGIGHILRHPIRSTGHGIGHVGHMVLHPFHTTANGMRHVGHAVRHPFKHIKRGIHSMTHY